MFYTICEKGAYFRIQRLIFYLSVFKIEISNRDAKTIHLNLNFQKSGVRNMGSRINADPPVVEREKARSTEASRNTCLI